MAGGQGLAPGAPSTPVGTQTALVVGLGGPVHTDRDGRIKVQFHWQRGAHSSHRLAHPSPTQNGDNAPAGDASGTWVRVGQAWAGANWGASFIPRLGQEVVVAFLEGDIDRPVVIGAVYNGQGSPNAQGNEVPTGAAQATGNAPAWFPGDQLAGGQGGGQGGEQGSEQEGHAHTATLSGFKSQSLDTSQSGMGGHHQLVFDDTPAQGRVLAHTTHHQTWLQMGHLLQQHDNQRLAWRGHGLELHTQAQGAVRAGSGLHISTLARTGGSAGLPGQPTDTRQAQGQLHGHVGLVKALGQGAPNPAPLPAPPALLSTLGSLNGTRSLDEHARIAVMDQPHMVLSSAADISSLTPAHTVVSVGQHTTITSSQDVNLMAQRHTAWAAKEGISLFTHGQASDGQRAVQNVGIQLHAASGNGSVQAQGGTLSLTALKAIDLQSTSANIVISALDKVVLNGAGSYLKIEGGDIEIGTSGQARFLASVKVLTGGASKAVPTLNFPRSPLDIKTPTGTFPVSL